MNEKNEIKGEKTKLQKHYDYERKMRKEAKEGTLKGLIWELNKSIEVETDYLYSQVEEFIKKIETKIEAGKLTFKDEASKDDFKKGIEFIRERAGNYNFDIDNEISELEDLF